MKKPSIAEAEEERLNMEYWKSMAPDGFVLIGWTYRRSALYRSIDGRGSLSITDGHVAWMESMVHRRSEARQ